MTDPTQAKTARRCDNLADAAVALHRRPADRCDDIVSRIADTHTIRRLVAAPQESMRRALQRPNTVTVIRRTACMLLLLVPACFRAA
jgi:hypothetical protein